MEGIDEMFPGRVVTCNRIRSFLKRRLQAVRLKSSSINALGAVWEGGIYPPTP